MNNEIYYNTPIELWQGYLENPHGVLKNVLDYCTAEYSDEPTARKKLCVKYGDFETDHENGEFLRNKKEYSGVVFSIPNNIYWEYRDSIKSEWENVLLLAFLALKSIARNGRIARTNSQLLCCRMSGFGLMEQFKQSLNKKRNKYDTPPAIYKYMKNPRLARYYCEKIRFDLMARYKHFHSFSMRGKRGFMFVFGNQYTRAEYWALMSKQMKNSPAVKRNELHSEMKRYQ